MDRINVLIALVAALALAVLAWSKPLEKLPSWVFFLLCLVFYPAGEKLLSTLESAAGSVGTLAEWTFTVSVNVLFAALVASAYRGIKPLQDTPADRHSDHYQEADA